MKIKKMLSFILSIVFVMSMVVVANNVSVFATADITPPTIDVSSISVSPKNAVIGDTVTVKVKITDSSKITYAAVGYDSPQSGNYKVNIMKFNPTSSMYEYSFTVTDKTECGTFRMVAIYSKDEYGNESGVATRISLVYQSYANLSAGDFSVSGTHADFTPPTIDVSSISVSPKNAVIGDTVTVKVKITDSSKITYAAVGYDSPQSGNYKVNIMKFNPTSSMYEYSFTVTDKTECGTFRMVAIYSKDEYGNESGVATRISLVYQSYANLSAGDFSVNSAISSNENYDYKVAIGETLSLSYEANCDIYWRSSDPSIAKIGNTSASIISMGSYKKVVSSCEIIPIKEGIVTIYATDSDGYALNSAKVKVTKAKILIGDVTNDGIINSNDALTVLRYSVGQNTLTDNQFAAGDVSKDGIVNSVDALKILQYSVGQITEF